MYEVVDLWKRFREFREESRCAFMEGFTAELNPLQPGTEDKREGGCGVFPPVPIFRVEHGNFDGLNVWAERAMGSRRVFPEELSDSLGRQGVKVGIKR